MKKILPILLLYFVNGISFFILIPVLPFIVQDYGASKIWYTSLIAIFSAAQFVGSAWFGKLSDTYGRKKILIISQAGTLLSWIIFGLSYFTKSDFLGLTFAPLLAIGISRIADGLTGGNNSVASAYMADVIEPEERAKYFGYIGAAFGIAMIIGPALGGLSASYSIGYLGTAILAAGISLLTLISLFGLKESLAHEHRAKKQTFSLREHLFFLKKIQKFSNNKFVQNIFSINGIFSFVMSGYSSLIALYIIDTFDFNTKELSYFFFATGIFLFINQTFVLKFLVKKMSEFKTLLFGQACLFFGLILFTFPNNIWAFILLYYLVNLGVSLSFPTIKSLLSNSVDKTKQGEVAGLSESLMSLMSIFAPIVAGFLYIHIGGYAFWALGGLLLIEVFLVQKKVSCKK